MLVAGLVIRLVYVALQARTDPWFAFPVGDGADSLAWAREMASGVGLREGAYYAPPLYPYLLRAFFGLFGENLGLLYYLQHVALVGAAGLLALSARRLGGDLAGLATGALFLLYQPLLFFGSRPVGEPLGILLLCAGLAAWTLGKAWSPGTAGLLCGVASLARPNLALVAPFWAIGAWRRSGWRAAAWLMLGTVLALVPTTVRNHRASGHLVPVSANAGLTLYHGNGPGATGFIREPPELAQAGKGDQRRIATWVASQRAGTELDAVEADRWWGAEAVRERLDHPVETARLIGWRGLLTGWNAELTLDAGPRQDPNPMRWAAPLPFCVLLGLAAAGLVIAGWRRTGGAPGWGAVLACAAAPLLFYVSSRYRLPMAAMLCLPAGAGLAVLLRPPEGTTGRRRALALATLVLVVAGSMSVPAGELLAQADAAGLLQRGKAWRHAGDPARAEADFRLAVERNPGWAPSLFYLAEVLDHTGRGDEAELLYRRALDRHPTYANAACYLGQRINLDGRHEEALPVLRHGLKSVPFHEVCWNHLVGALIALERGEEAAREVERAAEMGVTIDAGLREAVQGSRAAGPGGDETGNDGYGGEKADE